MTLLNLLKELGCEDNIPKKKTECLYKEKWQVYNDLLDELLSIEVPDIKKDEPPLDYQVGYSNGYKEGFNKACEPIIREKMLLPYWLLQSQD